MPSTPTRRRFLVGVGLVTGGCLGGVDADGTAASSTDTSTSTPTSPRNDCSRPDSLPDGGGPAYPSLPSRVTGATAMDFALRFEAAYQRNRIRLLDGPVTYLERVAETATEPRPAESGYVVGVELDFEYGYSEHTSGPTATPGPAFEAERTARASYLVTTRRALRVETDELVAVHPRTASDASVVACADGPD